MVYLLLGLSICLVVGRSILSKKLSDIRFGTRSFFVCQGILCSCGTCVIALLSDITLNIAPIIVLYGLLYGVGVICAQWFYLLALSKGSISLCTAIYPLGFIIPTLSGVIFWQEPFSFWNLVGICFAVFAVVISGLQPKDRTREVHGSYFLPLLVALLAAGGLGLLQKLQQKSDYADQTGSFLLIAFLFASCVSFLFAIFAKRGEKVVGGKKKLIIAALAGLLLGSVNLLNTLLVGMLDSKIFFPTHNIGSIILTMICGVLLFKDKIGKKEIAVLIFGSASILLLSLA